MASENSDSRIEALFPEMVAHRRHFHRHPEIGFEEVETAKYIAKHLREWGFDVRTGVAETGIVATYKGQSDRTIAFRADMDALRVREESEAEYCSQAPGKMHACGHDGHMAIALGFAKWLSRQESPLPGNVMLIFQPGEEGFGGAKKMIEAGAFAQFRPEEIYGLHLWNNMPVGTAGISSGPIMASADMFDINIQGKGGHGAMPHQAVDSVIVAAHITTALQTIVSRNIDPLIPAVISVARIVTQEADNVIAERASLHGMVRTFDKDLREKIPALMERCASGVAQGLGASAEFVWKKMYPPTVNDVDATARVLKAAKTTLPDSVLLEDERTMGSEDFSYFLEEIPGCFFFIGSANSEQGKDKPHHNPGFDFDENALRIGLGLFIATLQDFFGLE